MGTNPETSSERTSVSRQLRHFFAFSVNARCPSISHNAVWPISMSYRRYVFIMRDSSPRRSSPHASGLDGHGLYYALAKGYRHDVPQFESPGSKQVPILLCCSFLSAGEHEHVQINPLPGEGFVSLRQH